MKTTNSPATSATTDLPLTMSSAMASTTKYHDYLWSWVAPHLGNRVLEVGVGFGQYTRRMLAGGRQVLACDLDEGHLRELKRSDASPLLGTLRLDLENPEAAFAVISEFAPDTVILLNVLEHIRTDVAALAFLRRGLSVGGTIVMIVPAMQKLTNGLDHEAGHHRRYSRVSMGIALKEAGWDSVTTRYINLPGMPGWLLAGWLSRASHSANNLNSRPTNGLLRLYDRWFVGLSRLSDPIVGRLAGLSLVATGRKRS